jgi:hypothetical protein
MRPRALPAERPGRPAYFGHPVPIPRFDLGWDHSKIKIKARLERSAFSSKADATGSTRRLAFIACTTGQS